MKRKTIAGCSIVLVGALLAPNFARRSPAEEGAVIRQAEPSRRVLDSFLLLGGEKKPVEGTDFQVSFTTSGHRDGTVFANAYVEDLDGKNLQRMELKKGEPREFIFGKKKYALTLVDANPEEFSADFEVSEAQAKTKGEKKKEAAKPRVSSESFVLKIGKSAHYDGIEIALKGAAFVVSGPKGEAVAQISVRDEKGVEIAEMALQPGRAGIVEHNGRKYSVTVLSTDEKENAVSLEVRPTPVEKPKKKGRN